MLPEGRARQTTHVRAADPRGVLAVLARDDLLRIIAALALDVRTEPELARATRLPARRVAKGLTTLAAAGMIESEGALWQLRRERFAQALGRATARPESDAPRELRGFFRGDHLVEIPAQRAKRLILLRYLARRFDRDRTYQETEVNEILRAVHADVASLRRYLVDEGMLARDHGIYRVA